MPDDETDSWVWRRFDAKCPYCYVSTAHLHSFDANGQIGIVVKILPKPVDNYVEGQVQL